MFIRRYWANNQYKDICVQTEQTRECLDCGRVVVVEVCSGRYPGCHEIVDQVNVTEKAPLGLDN